MKNYSTKKIKEFIEQNKGRILRVSVGMLEDWSWTYDVVYKDGEFIKKYKWDKASIEVHGICGSCWATPNMHVLYNDGTDEWLDCWEDDGVDRDPEEVAYSKLFARITENISQT